MDLLTAVSSAANSANGFTDGSILVQLTVQMTLLTAVCSADNSAIGFTDSSF
jgi:hypothetical protein